MNQEAYLVQNITEFYRGSVVIAKHYLGLGGSRYSPAPSHPFDNYFTSASWI